MRLKVDADGRIPIPMSMRDAMAIGKDGTVLAWLEDGELHVVSSRVAMRQAQDLARNLISGSASLADELIAERREEVRREREDS
jgi:bifunctional DNA-binding transcriptional regulator/antitoxin component of YhaV-PrlF toxin-antitoxin module